MERGSRLARAALLSLSVGIGALAGQAAARVHRTVVKASNVACNGAMTGDGCGSQIAGASFQRDPSTFPDYATGYDAVTQVPAGVGGAYVSRAQALRNAISGAGVFAGARINFNLPGVSYPIGPNPRAMVNLNSYAVNQWILGSASNGCQYQATGGGVNGTAPRVYCTGSIGAATLANIDFTNGGTSCATLEVQNVNGSLTVDNFKMEYRGNCIGAKGKANAFLINVYAPNVNFTALTLRDFIIDSNPVDCTNCMTQPLNANIIDQPYYSGHVLTMSYFAALNNTGRIVQGGAGQAGAPFHIVVDHFYIEGVSMGCTVYGQHGESQSIGSNASTTGNSQSWSYGVFVIPSSQPYYPHYSQFHDEGCLTAPLYFSTGQAGSGSSWTMEEGHVLSIINPPMSGHDTASAASIEISYDNYPNSSDVYVHDVWVDPRGSGQCAINAGSATGAGSTTPQMAIVDLYNGSTVTAFDNGSPCAGHGTP